MKVGPTVGDDVADDRLFNCSTLALKRQTSPEHRAHLLKCPQNNVNPRRDIDHLFQDARFGPVPIPEATARTLFSRVSLACESVAVSPPLRGQDGGSHKPRKCLRRFYASPGGHHQSPDNRVSSCRA